MENYLNIKYHSLHNEGVNNCITSLYRLVIQFILVLCVTTSLQAQPYFNKLYTNQATGSIFQSVSPQGSNGGFMAIALANDSTRGLQGIRASRISADGLVQSSSFLIQPTYTDCTLYPRPAAICKINENSFAIAGDLNFPDGRPNYSFVLLIDSNGFLQKFKAYANPYPSATDSLMLSKAIGFDGNDMVLFSDIELTATASKQLLTKFDTALHVLWEKTYTEGSNYRKLCYSLIADSTGYVASGYTDNGLYYYKSYKSRTFVFRTDTSGVVKWTYEGNALTGAAADIVRTADGGYVYSTTGNVYDEHPTYHDAYWYAQELLVKLDSSGHWQWSKIYDPHYGNFGVSTIRLLALPVKGFMTMYLNVDSPGLVTNMGYAALRKYSDTGELLWEHQYEEPTIKPVNADFALNDIKRTSEGSIIMAGYHEELASTAPPPAQRGWIVKLDSTGCMGPGDPQCWPEAIPPVTSTTNYINVYPNPSTGDYELQYTVQDNEPLQLVISDITGRILIQTKLAAQLNNYHIDAANWSTGVYVYQLSQEGMVLQTGKLIRQ